MGVPALFRWLSKKYPKTVTHVVEDKPQTIIDADGNELLIPVDITTPNPNGFEMDNLYLDMNGIVHPCTHPEGKPAPTTEQEMMLEIFIYTERVVNMIRPRKLLFMAIDGVAPRAKMNQQRSRRFRTAQENKEKEEQRLEGIALFEAMGKTVSEETKNVKTWDSNAITPGTPFMTLLADSLRYWVVKKLNTDPGWKDLEVIISDAGVPGEGEHKIMDFIRRQRISPQHDPNTKHVIYGLDADLIMLALATHEPHFRVLREDVFAQDANKGCRICGQEGHYAAQCTVDKSTLKDPAEKMDKPLAETKPFIFLDVSILREYLEFELDVPAVPFQFDFERAIDDWVLLIFFVGNDFLPHLPSLEIREGAIDMLVNIWKQELHRMRGYVTNHGIIEKPRLQVILDALSNREDGIFRRRRENEERQEQQAKRRKIEQQMGFTLNSGGTNGDANLPSEGSIPGLTPQPPTIHPADHGLPPKPSFTPDLSLPAKPGFPPEQATPQIDRASIRKANLQALQALKGEIKAPVITPTTAEIPVVQVEDETPVQPDQTEMVQVQYDAVVREEEAMSIEDNDDIPMPPPPPSDVGNADGHLDDGPMDADIADNQATRGTKRKLDEMETEDAAGEDVVLDEEEEEEEEAEPASLALKVNPDGTVDQVDTVRLWEPGYKERYYKQKFKGDANDRELRRNIVKHYLEGLMWVLHYYYQGAPSWQWYYPYHFAPFASDFEDIQSYDIKFEKGQPFKPFEQLMGVFPPASRQHIPEPLQHLMIDENSPIIDFYPTNFEIDMNGKRMAWQGVALLPFIDQDRLLAAVEPEYAKLNEEEQKRNSWGNNELFVSDSHPLFYTMMGLYGRNRRDQALVLDGKESAGLAGSLRADSDPEYCPGLGYKSPLEEVGQEPIDNDKSIHAFYLYPRQTIPHRSRLLPQVKPPSRILTSADFQHVQRGGRGGGRGGGDYRRGDDRRQFGTRPPDQRVYGYNYGSGGLSHHNGYSGGVGGWRGGSSSRGEPDYSYGGGTGWNGNANGHVSNSYRGLPPRGVGRGRGYAPR